MIWRQLKALVRARREGASLGDIAVMKFEMLSGASPVINARLRALGNGCFEVGMSELRALPDGTVGREYIRILDERGLQPLAISPAVKESFADKPYALRYTTTHDLFHVLTGFPTTPAGEIGLFAFMVGQGFAGGSRGRLWLTTALAILFLPLHAGGILHNRKVGFSMGKMAPNLLEQPLEAYLATPLEEARRRFNLPDPSSANIAPGHESLLSKWFNPKDAPQPAASAI